MSGFLHVRPLPAELRNVPKSFVADKITEDTPPLPFLPGVAVRLLPVQQPIALPVRLQSAVPPPLAEHVKARLCGDEIPTERSVPNYSSSGSDHDPSSVCLAAMVNEFMENEASFGHCGRARCNCRHRNCSGNGCCSSDSEESKSSSIRGELCEVLEGLVTCDSDAEARLLTHVMRFVNLITGEASSIYSDERLMGSTHGCLKRSVMKLLRRAGYNAAICKSRWDHSCGIPAGDYEFIDVLSDDTFRKNQRFIVDIDFRAQFEIARPTEGYSAVWQLLPAIFVGKPERLQQIVIVMSEAAKQSLKVKGLHLPPWRKPSYLKAKWFSPYKRTTNDITASCREGKAVNGRDFAGIAVRGSGLDARCTNELEMLYHDPSSDFLVPGLNGGIETIADGKIHGKWTNGALRDANKNCSERAEITMITTDWQPPPVAPRSTQKPRKVTGLASVLRHAGLAKPQKLPAKQDKTHAKV